MTAKERLTDLIEQLVVHGPEELTLPIAATDDDTHGGLLDHATGALELQGYQLRSIRISDGTWYATYDRGGPSAH